MKTKVFTDDVIQRIASGNEIQQTKKISLNVIETVLNPYEMRNVLGGSGGGSGGYPWCSGLCSYNDGSPPFYLTGYCGFHCSEIDKCYQYPFAGTDCYAGSCYC